MKDIKGKQKGKGVLRVRQIFVFLYVFDVR